MLSVTRERCFCHSGSGVLSANLQAYQCNGWEPSKQALPNLQEQFPCLVFVRGTRAFRSAPDQQSTDGCPPASSGSRAATHLAVLCVVPILSDRCRVGMDPVKKYCITAGRISIDRFPQDASPNSLFTCWSYWNLRCSAGGFAHRPQGSCVTVFPGVPGNRVPTPGSRSKQQIVAAFSVKRSTETQTVVPNARLSVYPPTVSTSPARPAL